MTTVVSVENVKLDRAIISVWFGLLVSNVAHVNLRRRFME